MRGCNAPTCNRFDKPQVLDLTPNPKHEGAHNCVLSDGMHTIGAVLEAPCIEAFERSMESTLDPVSRLEGALVYPGRYEIVLNMSKRQFFLKLSSFQWGGAENSERIGLPRFVMEDPDIKKLFDQTVVECRQQQAAAQQKQQQQQSRWQTQQQPPPQPRPQPPPLPPQQQLQQHRQRQQHALMQTLGRGTPMGCAAFPVEETEPHRLIARFLPIPPEQDAQLQALLRAAQGSQSTESHQGSEAPNSAVEARGSASRADSGGRSGSLSDGSDASGSQAQQRVELHGEPSSLPFALPLSEGGDTQLDPPVKMQLSGQTQLDSCESEPLPEDSGAPSSAEAQPAAQSGPPAPQPTLIGPPSTQAAYSQMFCSHADSSGAECSQAAFSQAPFSQPVFPRDAASQAASTQDEGLLAPPPESQAPFSQAPFSQAPSSQALFSNTNGTPDPFSQPCSMPVASRPESVSTRRPGKELAHAPDASCRPLLSQVPATEHHLPPAAEESHGPLHPKHRMQQPRPWERVAEGGDASMPEAEDQPDNGGVEEAAGAHLEEAGVGGTPADSDPMGLADFDPLIIVREVFMSP